MFSESESTFGNFTNSTRYIGSPYRIGQEDSSWIVSNAFIIFTMQTGFGMLESGCVSKKNEVNIMMKNVVDISLGGFTYWLFGFGISFGLNEPTNWLAGSGGYLLDLPVEDILMGPACSSFIFQFSFATTSTTIVSGAMAERCNFRAYCLFSLLNTVVYCVPAGWVWGDHGFLKQLGAVDIAGAGTVHLVGGVSAFACAIMLGPRLGRYDNGIDSLPLGNPVNAILGLFVLWWGWLAFNSGSSYGITEDKWKYAARASVSTIMGSIGGGLTGLAFSLTSSKGTDILSQINGILGALVSVTGGCFLFQAWEALIIGMIGGLIACGLMPFLDKLGVDDPVGATTTHAYLCSCNVWSMNEPYSNNCTFMEQTLHQHMGLCLMGATGIWGIIAIGLFADNPYPLDTTSGRKGLFKGTNLVKLKKIGFGKNVGGGAYLLSIQCLTVFCLALWSFSVSMILLLIVNQIIPIRMSAKEELLGADFVEHGIHHQKVGVSRALSLMRTESDVEKFKNVFPVGANPGHDSYLVKFNSKKQIKKFGKFVQPFVKGKTPVVFHLGVPENNKRNAWIE